MQDLRFKFIVPTTSGSWLERYYFSNLIGAPANLIQNARAVLKARHNMNAVSVKVFSMQIGDTTLPGKAISDRFYDEIDRKSVV